MNGVDIREGPSFNFIIPDHQPAFEKNVIDCYQKVMQAKGTKYEVPHIDIDLLDYIKLTSPVPFVAAREKRQNPDAPMRFNSGISESAQLEFAIIKLKESLDMREPLIDDLFYEDIVSILDFHHMSFVDLGYINEWGFFEHMDFYKNLPMRQVW